MGYFNSNREKVPFFHFTNSLLNADDRFDAWREYMISIADIEPLDGVRSAGLFSVETWNLGQIVFVNERNPGAKFFRTSKKVRTAAEDHYYLYLLREGSNTIHSYRGKAEQKRSRGIRHVAAFHSMAEVSHGVMEEMDCLMVFLPRDLFGHATSIMDRRTNENLLGPTGCLIANYISLIAGQLPKLTRQAAEGVSRSLVELVKAGFAQSDHKARDIDPDILQLVAKSRIRTYINNNLHDKSLSVDGICHVMALSRASLYRMFEEEGGIMSYILRRRMNAVLKELQKFDQEKSLPELAQAFGFKDAGELNRTLRRLSGESIRDINQGFNQRWQQPPELAHLTKALRSISSAAAVDIGSATRLN